MDWLSKIDSFKEIELSIGNRKVVWEYIGEGNEGDFNPDNETDVPLLRFSCSKFEGNKWEQMDDASYCTLMPVDSKIEQLIKAAHLIIQEIEDEVSEKEYDTEHLFEVEGNSGINFIPLGCVMDAMKQATKQEQEQIKNMLVKIDFANGDCLDFFRHCSQKLAI